MQQPTGDADAKAALRASILERRATRSAQSRADSAEAIAAHVGGAAFAQVPTVAAYLSMGHEPGTGPLLDLLHARGTDVLVPVAAADGALGWVRHRPDVRLTRSALGVPEPDGERLGPEALSHADLVVVPALAVDHTGWRLGRGAGYFDRALAHARAPICAIVFAEELLAEVPHDDHDVPVQLVVTESGIFRVFAASA